MNRRKIKRHLCYIMLSLFLSSIISCSSGERDGEAPPADATVQKIDIEMKSTGISLSASNYTEIYLKISGPDIEPAIEKTTEDITTPIQFSIYVPPGGKRMFLAQARDSSKNVIFEGSVIKDIEPKVPVSIYIFISKIIYVNSNSSCIPPDCDGSIDKPYKTIQDGIDNAPERGDTVIRVAGGDGVWYDESITMKPHITLEGGYSPDFQNRDLNQYKSTISGSEMGVITIYENMDTITIDGFTINAGSSEKGGGIAIDNASHVTITNNTIRANSAGNGGGISINNSSFITISRNTIINNNAYQSGGGIYLDSSSSVVIENNFITDNWSTNFGGGIYIIDSSSNITNNTISNNSSGDCADGSGVYIKSGTISIKNSIIWDNCESNYTDLYVETPGAVTVTYSDIGTRNIEIDATNISEYPQFEYVNIFNTYHITKDSPCIDKGTSDGAPTDDIDGQKRGLDGSEYDIGADEYYPQP